MKDLAAVILAAGKGTRMNSDLPKVLHTIDGKPMIEYVTAAATAAGISSCCVVVGHGAAQVEATLGDGYLYALQAQQLGTGHALRQALPVLRPMPRHLLVLCGDTPLLTGDTLSRLYEYFLSQGAACAVMTAVLPDAGSYGRILRDADGSVAAIVEARDATPAQKQIREINSGVYCFDSEALLAVINHIQRANDQGEYYLTDAVAALRQAGQAVCGWACPDAAEIAGVNDMEQLAQAAAVLAQRKSSRF